MTDPPDVSSGEPATAAGRLPFLAKYGRFLLVGLTGVGVNLAVFASVLAAVSPGAGSGFTANLLHTVPLTSARKFDDLFASIVAFVIATAWNFAWNNAWTFRSQVGHRHSTQLRFGLYYGVSLGSLAVNEAVLFATLSFLLPLYGQALGILLGSVVGFAGNKRFTFAERAVATEGREAAR